MSKQEQEKTEQETRAKSSNTAKIIGMIGGVGLVMAISAYSFGAHTGIYFDRTGVHIQPRDIKHVEVVFAEEEQITAVEVVGDNHVIRVERGDKISFRADYYETGYKYSVENGVLKITAEDKDWPSFNLGFQIYRDETLTVTVPENILTRLNVQNDNGRIYANNLTTNEITLKNSNGLIYANNIIADTLTIKNNNGRIDVDVATTTTATITNNNGRISANNVVGKLTVDNSNGSIEVTGVDQTAYLWLKNNNGSIRVNGDRKTDRPFTQGDADAPHSVRATNNNGSIRVDTK